MEGRTMVTLNLLALDVLNYIQDKKKFVLSKSERKFGRSSSTIKRTILQLNAYLPEENSLNLKQNIIYCNLSYDKKIALITGLSFNNYTTGLSERLELVIFTSFFAEIVNMSALYNEIGISRSTRKKDRSKIDGLFNGILLKTEIYPGKGIKIIGDEAKLRMYIAQRLATLLEFDTENKLRQRKANSPVERKLCEIFFAKAAHIVDTTQGEIATLFNKEGLRADYASRKLILIYYCMSKLRCAMGAYLTDVNVVDILPVEKYSFFAKECENNYMQMIVYSLNYNKPLAFPKVEELYSLAEQLVDEVQQNIVTKILTYHALVDACYNYIYKSLVKNHLGYMFYDDKIADVQDEYPLIVEIIRKFNNKHTFKQQQILKDDQIKTLSLVFSTFILKNKVYKEDKQKIVIITNSSSEKVGFWAEQLRKYIDFELVDFLTLNELHYLVDLEYDIIVTFSSRITHIMYNLGYLVERMPFHLKEADVEGLYKYGFSSNYQRKIEKAKFMEEIQGLTVQEIAEHIGEKYADYFIGEF